MSVRLTLPPPFLSPRYSIGEFKLAIGACQIVCAGLLHRLSDRSRRMLPGYYAAFQFHDGFICFYSFAIDPSLALIAVLRAKGVDLFGPTIELWTEVFGYNATEIIGRSALG